MDGLGWGDNLLDDMRNKATLLDLRMRIKAGITLRVILLLGWVLGIVLPLYSFRRFSPAYQTAFDWVFNTDISHVLMHTFLYAVLSSFLTSLLYRLRWTPGRVFAWALAGVIAVALLQEAIQMTCEHVALGSDEIFDFFVDLNGGLLGAMLYTWISRRKKDKLGWQA